MHKILIKIVDTLILNYYYLTIIYLIYADVAELADAQASGACGSNTVWVQVPSPAAKNLVEKTLQGFFVYIFEILSFLLIDWSNMK